MVESVLEILRIKFPLIVANLIFNFFIQDLKYEINSDFLYKYTNKGIKGIAEVAYRAITLLYALVW